MNSNNQSFWELIIILHLIQGKIHLIIKNLKENYNISNPKANFLKLLRVQAIIFQVLLIRVENKVFS
jgi:hypothetical protein